MREFLGRLQRQDPLADLAHGPLLRVPQGELELAQLRPLLDQRAAAVEPVEQRQAQLHAGLPLVAPVVARGVVRIGIRPRLRDVAGHLGPIAAFRDRHAFALHPQGVFRLGQIRAPLQRRPRRVGERNLLDHQRHLVHQFRRALRRRPHQAIQGRIGHVPVVPRLQDLRPEIRHLHLRAQPVVVRRHALPPPRLHVFQLPFRRLQRLLVHRQQMLAQHRRVVGADGLALHGFRRRADRGFRPFAVQLRRPQRRADPPVEERLRQPQACGGLILEARGNVDSLPRRSQFLVAPDVIARQRQHRQGFRVGSRHPAARDLPAEPFLLERAVVALRQRHGFPQQQRTGQIDSAVRRGFLRQIVQAPLRRFRAQLAHLPRVRHPQAARQPARQPAGDDPAFPSDSIGRLQIHRLVCLFVKKSFRAQEKLRPGPGLFPLP